MRAVATQRGGARAGAGKRPRVAVVGAGAFGGWTALHLLRRGARVTLVDAWGPGHSRSSSGGETRILRATYGPEGIYTRLAARALELWRENEARWKIKLFHRTGVLWMVGPEEAYARAALGHLRQARLEFDRLSARECARRFPQINFEDVQWAIFEPEAGYLTARRACAVVRDALVDEGGEYRELGVVHLAMRGGELRGATLTDGSQLAADAFVFACGPWLPKIFPEVLKDFIRPTRQEVFFFGTPPGDGRFSEGGLPVWIDHGERLFYGIPGNQGRGLKLGDDTRGESFDPTTGNRAASANGLEAARDYLGFRFPQLRGAPLVEARVCQYEQTRDSHFLVDWHPAAGNVLLLGGGSGHGFKHGPALGEKACEVVLGGRKTEKEFSLKRLSNL